MASDEYFVDEKPSVRGGPPATDGQRTKTSNVLTQKAGPLPVYGWVVVAVAAVFLYRRITSSGATAGQPSGAVTPTPNQDMGGIFLLPGSGGGPGGASSSPNTAIPDVASSESASELYNQLTGLYAASSPNHNPTPIAAMGSTQQQLQAFYNGISGVPQADRQSLSNFFATNAANKNLGRPYMTGVFDSAGNAQQYDPSTGTSVYLNPATGAPAS